MSQIPVAWHCYRQIGFTAHTKASRRPALRLCMRMASSGGTLKYKLTDASTLVLEQGDLTKYHGEAIVNAANDRLLGGGGVDGAIHTAAGPRLLEACKALPIVHKPSVRCPTGDAKITQGFDLPAKWVIHTVGPIYSQYSKPEAASLLADAHKNSLTLANEKQLRSVAFPAISCGVYGYPLADAAKVALTACREAAGNMEEVAFILFSRDTFSVWREAAEAMQLQSL